MLAFVRRESQQSSVAEDCSHSIPDTVSNKTVRQSLTNVADVDNLILMSGDFLTALFAGAPDAVLKQLYVRENWTIKRVRDYNDKCAHEVKSISLSEDDEDDEDEEKYLEPCCRKEQDELVLTDELQYIILEYLAKNGTTLDNDERALMK